MFASWQRGYSDWSFFALPQLWMELQPQAPPCKTEKNGFRGETSPFKSLLKGHLPLEVLLGPLGKTAEGSGLPQCITYSCPVMCDPVLLQSDGPVPMSVPSGGDYDLFLFMSICSFNQPGFYSLPRPGLGTGHTELS